MMEQLNLPGVSPVYRLKIERDFDPENPREWDNLGTMACWHGRYQLGDERTVRRSPDEYRLYLAEEAEPGFEEKMDRAYNRTFHASSSWQDIGEWRQARIDAVLERHYIMVDLYLYDHSGLAMSTGSFSCPWDSGQVGFIYVSVAQVKREWGWKRLTAKRRKQIEACLTGEVQTYDQYLQGQVYGYVVEKHEDGEWEEVDSCWGFYGDDIDGVHQYMPDTFTREQVAEAFGDIWFDGCDGRWVQTGVVDEDA